VAGEIGEGSNAFDTSVFTGLIISIASVLGEACAARRSRRPTSRIAAPITRTEKTYAPAIAEIWAGRYERSRNDDAARGGPLPGGGAGAFQMLTCQMLVGLAVAAV